MTTSTATLVYTIIWPERCKTVYRTPADLEVKLAERFPLDAPIVERNANGYLVGGTTRVHVERRPVNVRQKRAAFAALRA